MDRLELAEELYYYASIEGSELGEYWEALSRIYTLYSIVDKEFLNAVDKEVKAQLQFIKNEFEIVKTKETREVVYERLKHESE
jgi:hypothetical protein